MTPVQGLSEAVAYPKVRIRYQGPPGSHSVAGLATRTKYGRHEYGDVFWVHRADAEADPESYFIMDEGDSESQAGALPKTPDGLRLPEAQQGPIGPEAAPQADQEPAAPEAALAASAEAAPAQTPAELATLDQIGVSDQVTVSLAQVGLLSVAEVVVFVQANGEESLRAVEGVGKKGAKEVIGLLREGGYLEGGS